MKEKTFYEIGIYLESKGFTEIEAKALVYDIITAWQRLK